MTKKTEEGNEYKKGLWTVEEDNILVDYVKAHGKGQWNRIAKKTGLKRCGKSCRLRWMNYLSPNVKRGNFTDQEEDLIVRLHKLLGNRWSLIAKRVPGRTDNQVKNYWNTHLSKKLGIKEQQNPKASNFETEDPTKAVEHKFMQTSGSNHLESGPIEPITKNSKGIIEQLFLGKQSVPMMEEESFVKSFWVHEEDDVEWSALTSLTDFIW